MSRFSFLLRTPFIAFIAMLLLSSVVGYAMITVSASNHTSISRSGFFTLKTEYLQMDFPKNWYAAKVEDFDETRGSTYMTFLVAAPLRAVALFRFYDEKASQYFISENNITDTSSINALEIEQLFELTRQDNENATLNYIEKDGTIVVSGQEASKFVINIEGGLPQEDESFGNLKGLFMSFLRETQNGRKITMIIYYGEENDWERGQSEFLTVLDSLEMI